MIEQFKIVKSHGWMVGNSPRSDINPALQSGLNAVFIPHSATWELEKSELESGSGRLLIPLCVPRTARTFLEARHPETRTSAGLLMFLAGAVRAWSFFSSIRAAHSLRTKTSAPGRSPRVNTSKTRARWRQRTRIRGRPRHSHAVIFSSRRRDTGQGKNRHGLGIRGRLRTPKRSAVTRLRSSGRRSREKMREFPEVDRAAWFSLETAREKNPEGAGRVFGSHDKERLAGGARRLPPVAPVARLPPNFLANRFRYVVAGEKIQLNGRIRSNRAFEALPRQPQSGCGQDICSLPKIFPASVSESDAFVNFRCKLTL